MKIKIIPADDWREECIIDGITSYQVQDETLYLFRNNENKAYRGIKNWLEFEVIE